MNRHASNQIRTTSGQHDAYRNAFSALKDRRALLFLPFPPCIWGLSLWLPTIIKAFGVSDPTAMHSFWQD
ncbi:hypothetical protein [Paraburkholderia oxyphila]|uniref:hypothetical protein n=1 Tax=Paraburkholderia oxyphila TaxID=614212 RepID=UPI0004814B20|nr:hypothetical protein [Paraburkholderia oxyphila]